MEVFDTVSNFFKGKIINDPMFGELKPNRLSSHRYWYGKVKFAPTEREITIYIFDIENGVSEEHRKFYIELENNYSKISENIADFLHKAYNESNGKLLRQDVWSRFALVELSFPRQKKLKERSFGWDLYYSYDPDKPVFNVEMKNWKPEECYSGE